MKISRIVLVLLCILTAVWAISVLKCEILTVKFGNQFVSASLCDVPWYFKGCRCKVLKYAETTSRIFYYGQDIAGTADYRKDGERWQLESDYTAWSRYGIADELYVWPYLIWQRFSSRTEQE